MPGTWNSNTKHLFLGQPSLATISFTVLGCQRTVIIHSSSLVTLLRAQLQFSEQGRPGWTPSFSVQRVTAWRKKFSWCSGGLYSVTRIQIVPQNHNNFSSFCRRVAGGSRDAGTVKQEKWRPIWTRDWAHDYSERLHPRSSVSTG